MFKWVSSLYELVTKKEKEKGKEQGRARSPKWDKLRDEYVKRNGKCEACGTTERLEVHHCFPYHLYPELELAESNLMVLCREHHFTFGHLCDFKAWNPSVREDVKLFLYKVANRPYGSL